MGRKYKLGNQKKKRQLGLAASANPTMTKFRATAMSQWQRPVGVDEMVDAEGNEKMNATQTLEDRLEQSNLNDDARSTGANGGRREMDDASSVCSQASLLSTLSNCTNPTFDVLHRQWNSGSQLFSDCVAVLAAVTDVIDSKGGSQSEPEYMAALLTALDGMTDEDETRMAATLYLLSLTMRKTCASVLTTQFGVILGVLAPRLHSQANCQSPQLVRHLLTCVGVLLAAQNQSIWNDSSNRQIFKMCLHFTTCDHARARKEARKVVQSLVAPPAKQPNEEARVSVSLIADCAEFCGNKLEDEDEEMKLHSANLLVFIMHVFPDKYFKPMAEALLKMFASGSARLTLTCIRSMKMTMGRLVDRQNVSAQLNAKILMALYDLKPLTKDSQLCSAWMHLFGETLVCLHSRDESLCLQQMPKLVETCIECIKEGFPELVISASKTLCYVFESCVTSNSTDFKHIDAAIEPIAKEINVLSIKYLDRLLFVSATLVGVCGVHASNLPTYTSLLQKLAALREAQSTSPATQAAVDKVIGESVKWAGAEFVLKCVPLDLDPLKMTMPLDWTRSWLLPLLHNYIHNGSIEFYATNLLPLAMQLKKRVEEWKKNKETSLAYVYGVVYNQLWNILPVVCQSATDVNHHFQDIAKLLGVSLMQDTSLRLVILKALRALINATNEEEEEDCEKEKDREELAKYAHNFIPILLNLYLAQAPNPPILGYDFEGVRLSLLEAIRCYVRICPMELLEKYVGKALERLEEEGKEKANRAGVMDVINSTVDVLSLPMLETIFNKILQWLKPTELSQAKKEHRVQKKSFRFVEMVVTSENEQSHKFVEKNYDVLTEVTMGHNDCVLPSSSASCLVSIHCLLDKYAHLMDKRKDANTPLTNSFKWAVNCLTTRYNVKTRYAAAHVISYLAVKLAKGKVEDEESDPAALPDFEVPMNIIWDVVDGAMKAEDNGLVTAGITAVRVVVLEYGVDMESSVVSALFGRMTPHLVTKHKQTLAQTLRLLLTVIRKFADYVVGQYMPIFLPLYFKQDPHLRSSLRKLNALVLKYLMLKYGEYMLLNEAHGEEWVSMITSVRKSVNRNDRKRQLNRDSRSKLVTEDDECTLVSGAAKSIVEPMFEDEQDNKSIRSHKSRNPIWIKEDVVDLLDSKSMITQVTTTNPSTGKTRRGKISGGFKTAKDGRLMITEEESDGEQGEDDQLTKMLAAKGGKGRRTAVEDSDGDIDAEIGSVVPGRKRKAMSEVGSTTGYRPGGSGIHRPLNEPPKKRKFRGDIKKPGDALDPYSYERLDVKSLKKRGKAGNKHKFSKFFGGKRKHRQ